MPVISQEGSSLFLSAVIVCVPVKRFLPLKKKVVNNYFIEPIITFFLPTSVAYPRLKVVHQVQLLEQSGKKTMHAFAGPVMTEILKHLDLHLTVSL